MQGMSLCSSEGNKLIEKIDKALEISRIMKDVECFSYLDRYTGSEDGEKAAERIAKRMEELGIPVEREIYHIEAFREKHPYGSKGILRKQSCL